MKTLPLLASLRPFQAVAAALLAMIAASSAHAWSTTLYLLPSAAEVFTESDLPANSTADHRVYIPNYNTGNPPELYFCLEMLPVLNTLTARAEMWFWTAAATTPPLPTGTPTKYQLGSWTPVSGQTNIQTFALPTTQPSGYTILKPSGATTLQYKLGYRIYGKVRGPTTANTAFVRPILPTGTNASIKLTISDQPLLENWEPDAVALPVTNPWGEPSITVNGVADKATITAPIPASYTVAWNAAGATSFKVTGGTGAGAVTPAAGITSGTSRAFTGVPQSTQSYVLETQGPAALAWKLTPAGGWEIFKGSTLIASGSGTQATGSATTTGSYTLRVNGITKTAEDEVINVTDGFLKRSKTLNLTIGTP